MENLNEKRLSQQAKQMYKEVNTVIDVTTLIDNLPIAIFFVSRDGTILLRNRMSQQILFVETWESKTLRFGDMIGCSNVNENASGCGYSESCHRCRVKTKIDQAFAAKKSISQFETTISTRSMGVRSIRMTVTYVRVNERPKTELEMCIVTIEDMTELKKKERMEAASETIGAICHEMNQPLQAIMGNVELLTQFQLEEGAVSKINKIFSEMERIQSINSKLMNLTQYETKPYLSTNILDVERSAGTKKRSCSPWMLAYVRRKFADLAKTRKKLRCKKDSAKPLADKALDSIGQLYRIGK